MPLLQFNSEKDDIYSRVQQAGISATMIEDKNKYLEKIGVKVKEIDCTWWVLDISNQDFNYVVRFYEYNRGGSVNFLDYIVAGSLHSSEKSQTDTLNVSQKGLLGKMASNNWWKSLITTGLKKRTRISIKKEKGRVIDIGWKGDDLDFILKLNSDSILKQKIIERSQASKDSTKITIHYMSRQNYGVIRTENFKPTTEDFEIMNMIARHIKSAWFRR